MVDIYYNLKEKCLSVRSKGKVIEYMDGTVIRKPKFIVQPGGRKRVIKEKRKNVHAFVRGDRVDLSLMLFLKWVNGLTPVMITYNPYKYRSFMAKSIHEKKLKPIHKAEYVIIDGKNMVAWI